MSGPLSEVILKNGGMRSGHSEREGWARVSDTRWLSKLGYGFYKTRYLKTSIWGLPTDFLIPVILGSGIMLQESDFYSAWWNQRENITSYLMTQHPGTLIQGLFSNVKYLILKKVIGYKACHISPQVNGPTRECFKYFPFLFLTETE